MNDEQKLRAFAKQVMTDWYEFAGIDGQSLHEIAIEHGLLAAEIVHQPCGESCNCEFYAEPTNCDWEAGVKCYRPTKLLRGEE